MRADRRAWWRAALFIAVGLAAFPGRAALAVSPAAEELAAARAWTKSAFQPGGNPPFSFVYGGQHAAQLFAAWKREESTRKVDDRVSVREIKYTDPNSGVELRCVVTEYADYPAVEWVLYFIERCAAIEPGGLLSPY